jgi:Mandelate racemase / muconate lactonizing enzyme, N-terminal domain
MEKAPGCAPAVPVGRFEVWAYQFPTDGPGGLESDGTFTARLRNAGCPGIGTMAVAAVDIARWDLRARLLDQPLYRTLPAFRNQVPVYGSGGFTNYPLDRLADQLAGGSSRASRG